MLLFQEKGGFYHLQQNKEASYFLNTVLLMYQYVKYNTDSVLVLGNLTVEN